MSHRPTRARTISALLMLVATTGCYECSSSSEITGTELTLTPAEATLRPGESRTFVATYTLPVADGEPLEPPGFEIALSPAGLAEPGLPAYLSFVDADGDVLAGFRVSEAVRPARDCMRLSRALRCSWSGTLSLSPEAPFRDGERWTLSASVRGRVEESEITLTSGALAPDAGTGLPDASVDPSMPRLTVAITGSGRVVSAPPGIDCGPTCSATFPLGTAARLHAFATGEPGARVSFAGDCMGVDGSGTIAAVTLDRDRRCEVSFTSAEGSFDVFVPFVEGRVTTGSFLGLVPETYDLETHRLERVTTTYPDVVLCDWTITQPSGEVIERALEGCSPLTLGREGSVPLLPGYVSLEVVVERAGGVRSRTAMGSIRVED